MAWIKKLKKQCFVTYWLILVRTNKVTGRTDIEYYNNKSQDREPNIFIDDGNNNEVDKDFWTPTTSEVMEEDSPELMKTETYDPASEVEEDYKTERVYLFSLRTDTMLQKVRKEVRCAECEYYRPEETRCVNIPRKIFWCNFRNGQYYYCPGYADAKTCYKCRGGLSGAKGRCLKHAEKDFVTGEEVLGDCSQWNKSGECEDFSENFEIEDDEKRTC